MEIEDAKVTLHHFLIDHLMDPEAEELCEAIRTILNAQDEIGFLRRPITDMDFTEIEKALGLNYLSGKRHTLQEESGDRWGQVQPRAYGDCSKWISH